MKHAPIGVAKSQPDMKPNRNYVLLLTGQFLSAFGDNAILALILGPVLVAFKNGTLTAQDQQFANIFYTSLLFIPYVLLAPLAGYLNDRYSKTRWLIGGNLFKLLGTILCALSLAKVSSLPLLGIGYFIVGIGACVYSPAKYGILPEILPVTRLVKANGTVELLTLVAILLGTITGAWLFDHWPLAFCYGVVIGVYGLSTTLNFLMTATPSYPEVRLRDSVGGFFQNTGALLGNRRLARVLLGTSTFWICGAMMKMNFQPWGQQVLRFQNATDVALLGLWLSIGIMGGSVLAGQFYKVGELRATRRWGWLLSLAIACLGGVDFLIHRGFTHPQVLSIAILIVAGLIAGLFLIPLNATLQAESHQDKLGKTIATQNCLENLAMVLGSALAFVNVRIGFDPSQLFLGLAAFVFLAAAWLNIPQNTITENRHESRC
jgi:LPLT family lysophospholipid transporter-like MFS transporter